MGHPQAIEMMRGQAQHDFALAVLGRDKLRTQVFHKGREAGEIRSLIRALHSPRRYQPYHVHMNGPAQFTPPSLPPLSAYRPSGSAATCSLQELGLGPSAWQSGLLGLVDQGLGIRCDPTPLESPTLVSISPQAADLLGVSEQQLSERQGWLDLLSGQKTLVGQPSYASVYAGHQFGVFVPRLGDGRALNIGMLNGWELQLKGAGPTPYARHADGRAVLRSSIREYLCSEFMAALGVPTTRALSLVSAATPVFRETTETAAVVCRMAPSFVRFGHFEYLASQNRPHEMQALVNHLISNQPLFETLREQGDEAQRNRGFFEIVARQTARLMAQWTSQGFMHGVMNTDNFSILGLTIDYGPFGWMDVFSVGHICNHSDHQGRYAYGQQPSIGLWNLQRLLVALSSLNLGADIQAINERLIESYEADFQQTYRHDMANKLGLKTHQGQAFEELLQKLYLLLSGQTSANQAGPPVDYPGLMRAFGLVDPRQDRSQPDAIRNHYQGLADQVFDRQTLAHWLHDYRALWLSDHGVAVSDQALAAWQARVRQANPAFVLRNWVAQEIIQAAQDDDWTGLRDGLRIFANPFDEHPDLPHRQHWRAPPPDWAAQLEVSCSS